MKEDKVAFIVRVENDFNRACRCINSIRRQTVKAYKIVVFAYDEALAAEIEKVYPKLKVVVVNDNRGYRNKVNSFISNAKVKYFILADSDSVFTADTVETVLGHSEDVVVFNMSKFNGNTFKPFYTEANLSDVSSFLSTTLSVWNIAFSTDLPIKSNFGLKGLIYYKQMLFVASCLAFAESVAFENKTLVYKTELAKVHSVTAEQFAENKKDIKRVIDVFEKNGCKEAKMYLVRKFVLKELEESFSLPFFKRLKKIIPIIRLLWF